MEEVQNLGDKNIWERESAKHNYTMLFFRIGKNWAQCYWNGGSNFKKLHYGRLRDFPPEKLRKRLDSRPSKRFLLINWHN